MKPLRAASVCSQGSLPPFFHPSYYGTSWKRKGGPSPSYRGPDRSLPWTFQLTVLQMTPKKELPFLNHLNFIFNTARDMLLIKMLLKKKKKTQDCKFPAVWAGNTYSAVTGEGRILGLNGCPDSNVALNDVSRLYYTFPNTDSPFEVVTGLHVFHCGLFYL